MSRIAAALSAAALLFMIFAPVDAPAQVVLDCEYFNFQEQAQAIFDNDPSDPYLLDELGDGFACPDLPSAGPDPDFPDLPANGDYQCVDFPYQEMAQVIYDEDVTDPYNLDPTGDGVACSLLPLQADQQGNAADAGGADDDREARRAARRAERDTEQQGGNQNQNQDQNQQNADAGDDQAAADDGSTTDEDEREARRAARQAAREAEQNAGDE